MCRSAVGKDITQRELSAHGLTLQHAHMTSPSKNFNLLNFFPYFVSQKKLFRVPNPSILIAAKLYQWEVLFCLLCFHPPSWYFSHEHFGSRTVFCIFLIPGLCALRQLCMSLQHNQCTNGITRCEMATLRICIQDHELELNTTNDWCSWAVWMWGPIWWAPCTRNQLLQGVCQL